MRLNGVWKDVCVRNISSRGMLIQAASAPPRGTYVEVCRGRHLIVARVAWSREHRFGIQTQERLNLDAVLKEPDLSSVDYTERLKAQPTYERRSTPRQSQAELRWRAERSRFFSKALEFACVGAMGASAALLMFDTVSGVLLKPVAAMTAALAK
jgi:hypothetical protein